MPGRTPLLLPRLCPLIMKLVMQLYPAHSSFTKFFFFGSSTGCYKAVRLIRNFKTNLAISFPHLSLFFLLYDCKYAYLSSSITFTCCFQLTDISLFLTLQWISCYTKLLYYRFSFIFIIRISHKCYTIFNTVSIKQNTLRINHT
jgi:hypothetical protein